MCFLSLPLISLPLTVCATAGQPCNLTLSYNITISQQQQQENISSSKGGNNTRVGRGSTLGLTATLDKQTQ